MRAAALARAFVRTLWLQRRLRTRADISRWQARQVESLMRHAAATTAFYRNRTDQRFEQLPLVDKSDLMGAFADFNTLALGAPDAWSLVEGAGSRPGYAVGCSTGTSGNRGFYLVSDAERFAWLGTILAKTIPDVLWRRHKVAVILPRSSALYDAANQSRLVRLAFFDLRAGFARLVDPLVAFGPSVVVAPPRVLRWLAEQAVAIAPKRLFSGAEPLDPPDRRIIERHFGFVVRDIYMATEGLLGVACQHGTLHLAEDVMRFEFEPVGDNPLLVSPVITDLTRRTQVMARYRLNDLLLLRSRPCLCGSPYRAIAEVIGRRDDMVQLAVDRALVPITPDILRNAILDSDRSIDDFRLVQTGPRTLDLVLPLSVSASVAHRAATQLGAVCASAGASPVITLVRETIPVPVDHKLRRVEARWKPDSPW